MYEYIHVKCIGGFLSEPKFREVIKKYAAMGYRLVQVLPMQLNSNGNPTEYEIIFEKPVQKINE